MKAIIPCIALAAAQLMLISSLSAQNAAASHLQAPPQNITVDGSVKEWGDSLRYYNAEKQINYDLANDADNLYMAVRIDDRLEQQKVLHSGLTLSVNTKGKKKEMYSITFPLNLQGGNILQDLKNDRNDEDIEQQQEALKQAVLTNLRGIKVEGFTEIEGNMITTSNTYGIKTAISYDDKGYLVCEASIPLKFFHAGNLSKNEWAFNFKINGATRPTNPETGGDGAQGGGRGGRGGGGFGGGGGRGGHGGGGRGGSRGGQSGDTGSQGAFFKSEDFWAQFYLAK